MNLLYFSKSVHADTDCGIVILPLSSMRFNGVLTDIMENLQIATVLMHHYFGQIRVAPYYDRFIKDTEWEKFKWFVKAHGYDAVIGMDFTNK